MAEPRLEYELIVRQQPKAARMCGLGGKADRRPIDPPPIIQLRVLEYAHPSSSRTDPVVSNDFLQNPYYFMFASLASPDSDDELHVLKDGKTRCTTGSIVSSLYHLKDTENDNQDAGFFVFPDLSVRTEGSYRLKLSLFEVKGPKVHHCKSIFSNPFYVYTAKKFPGMEESTQLSCSLADQGIKIRIRKEIRQRKKAGAANPIGPDDGVEDSSPSLSPTIATNKRPRQASDVVKGKGKATTRIAKRPKLVEASPTLEHVHLNDDSAIPNSAPAMSGNTNAASAGASTDSWTTNENVNGFSAAPATSSWVPPQTQSVQDSSANPEYRAVQHPPPSRPSQNSSPYPPPSQPHPQPATSSPNWGRHATQSPHHVPTFVPTPAPPSGYSSAAPATAAPTTSQHNLVTPSPPSAPIPQHSTSSGSMPVSAPLPRQPSRHTYDVAPPHETPYGSPLEMHAPPPGNANSQGPGVTYGPAYARYYTPQAPSQSPSMYSYTPNNSVPPNDYGDRELRDRAVNTEGRDPHMPSNTSGPPPPPLPQLQPAGYGPYPVPHPQSHYPSPVPPPASSGYAPQHTPYMSSSSNSNEREPAVHYNSMPLQYHQSPHHQPQQHHTQSQQQMMRQVPPPQTHPSFPGPTYHGAHGQPEPQQSPAAYPAYRRQESGGLVYGPGDVYGQNGPNGGHDRNEPRPPSPQAAGTGPASQGDSQVQQHLTLPPLRGGPVPQYSHQQHLHHQQQQQQPQQPHPPPPLPQQPQQQRTPIMAQHPHPQTQQHAPIPGYYTSPPVPPHPQPHHHPPHRTMSGMGYAPQPLPGQYVASQEDGIYHPDMYNSHRPTQQGPAAQWKRPMMVGNRTPPGEQVGMHRTNSMSGAMSMLRSQPPTSIVSGALEDSISGGHIGNGVNASVGVGIKKNPLSIGHIVSDGSSS